MSNIINNKYINNLNILFIFFIIIFKQWWVVKFLKSKNMILMYCIKIYLILNILDFHCNVFDVIQFE